MLWVGAAGREEIARLLRAGPRRDMVLRPGGAGELAGSFLIFPATQRLLNPLRHEHSVFPSHCLSLKNQLDAVFPLSTDNFRISLYWKVSPSRRCSRKLRGKLHLEASLIPPCSGGPYPASDITWASPVPFSLSGASIFPIISQIS